MKEYKPLVYFAKVVIFWRDYTELISGNFGTKTDWAKHFEPHKHNDKNVQGIVDYLINIGALKQRGENKNGNAIYHPDKDGAFICQLLIEQSDTVKYIDDIFDVTRNAKKGSQSVYD